MRPRFAQAPTDSTRPGRLGPGARVPPISLACVLAGLLLAPAVPGLPASSSGGDPTAAPGRFESMVPSLLLPVPPGYCAAPQVHIKQADPNGLSEAQRRLIFFPYCADSSDLIDRSMGW